VILSSVSESHCSSIGGNPMWKLKPIPIALIAVLLISQPGQSQSAASCSGVQVNSGGITTVCPNKAYWFYKVYKNFPGPGKEYAYWVLSIDKEGRIWGIVTRVTSSTSFGWYSIDSNEIIEIPTEGLREVQLIE
jgi:hypothetical protein